MLDAGDPAPDFDLPRPTTDGSETYRLSAAAREGPVVLAFYPVADTAGAGALLRELAAVGWDAVTGGLAILAVGVGDRASHDELADGVDVPFPLLLDEDGFFADRYGVLEPVSDDAVRVRPSVFVVDRRCFVADRWTAGRDGGGRDDGGDRDGDGERNGDSLPLDAVRRTVASL